MSEMLTTEELLTTYQKLVQELTTDSPDKKKLKPLFQKCGLSFCEDPNKQMTTVLEGLNQVRAHAKETI